MRNTKSLLQPQVKLSDQGFVRLGVSPYLTSLLLLVFVPFTQLLERWFLSTFLNVFILIVWVESLNEEESDDNGHRHGQHSTRVSSPRKIKYLTNVSGGIYLGQDFGDNLTTNVIGVKCR